MPAAPSGLIDPMAACARDDLLEKRRPVMQRWADYIAWGRAPANRLLDLHALGIRVTYPRTKALRYVIEHDFSIDYSRAEPLSRDEASFDFHIDDKRACFTLKESYATVPPPGRSSNSEATLFHSSRSASSVSPRVCEKPHGPRRGASPHVRPHASSGPGMR
jgi:hypothetical protein